MQAVLKLQLKSNYLAYANSFSRETKVFVAHFFHSLERSFISKYILYSNNSKFSYPTEFIGVKSQYSYAGVKSNVKVSVFVYKNV